MGHQLILELTDELYEPLSKEAAAVGKPLDEWILTRLWPLTQQWELSESEREAMMAKAIASTGCDDNERELQISNVKIIVDKLVKEYFDIEEGIKSIVWVNPNHQTEIWLIEVDTTAIPAGRVEPFYFKPNEEVPYPVRIANITPDEWEAAKSGKIDMPEGWKLDGTERIFIRTEQELPVRKTS